jgi:hypothetical protein
MAGNPRAHRWPIRLLLIAVLVVAAVVAFRWWRDPAREVRGRVNAAAAAVSSRAGEGDLDRVARLAGLGKLLAPDVVVEAAPGEATSVPGIRGRDAVVGLASQLAAAGGPQTIELTDVQVTLDDAKTRAIVTAVVRVTSASPGETPRAGLASSFHGDVVRIELTRNSGDWLIARAAPEPALRR